MAGVVADGGGDFTLFERDVANAVLLGSEGRAEACGSGADNGEVIKAALGIERLGQVVAVTVGRLPEETGLFKLQSDVLDGEAAFVDGCFDEAHAAELTDDEEVADIGLEVLVDERDTQGLQDIAEGEGDSGGRDRLQRTWSGRHRVRD